MSGDVIFYGLNAKVLERASDVPEASKQVVYYSLAIGHHIGVFDCFKPLFRCTWAAWQALIDRLPTGEARRKLEGVARFGEITVDRSHTRLLGAAFAAIRDEVDAETKPWLAAFETALVSIEAEPAIYLMGRRLP